jgi:hypothetical protein
MRLVVSFVGEKYLPFHEKYRFVQEMSAFSLFELARFLFDALLLPKINSF